MKNFKPNNFGTELLKKQKCSLKKSQIRNDYGKETKRLEVINPVCGFLFYGKKEDCKLYSLANLVLIIIESVK